MLAPHPPSSAHHRGYSAPGIEKASQHVYDNEEISKISEVCMSMYSSYSFPILLFGFDALPLSLSLSWKNRRTSTTI